MDGGETEVQEEDRDDQNRESDPASGPSLGQVVGYRLIEELGVGGMGIVYRAEQTEPVRRDVALKIIRHGMNSKEVIARFDAERQALAMMDHARIAKVFDAGETEEGLPYFVMEIVAGAPLNEFCQQHKLTIGQRLELFVGICEAVQHAHQKGVIHRDLKPSNILVQMEEGTASPKIIDFGIAKAAAAGTKLTDQTLFTGFMQILGTPAYMSPEQAEISGLDIDTRTDVYALGVILYELLTDTLPFEIERLKNSSLAELEKILWEEEPPVPSKRLSSLGEGRITEISTSHQTTPRRLLGQVAGELDWIVMKAIEKERSRRYPSALALAEDVRRYLNNDPVTASPPSRLYLVSKFVRRHRFGIGMATALVATLVAATGVSVWQAMEANEARGDAEVARNEAEKESAAAKQNLKINTRLVQFFINDMLEMGNPLKEPDRDITLRTIIDRAADRVDASFKEERDIRFAISLTLGRLYSNLGEYEQAQQHLETAEKLGFDLWGEEGHEFMVGLNNALGTVFFRRDDLDRAEVLFSRARDQHLRFSGKNSDTYVYSLTFLGWTKLKKREFAEARALFEECLPLTEKVLGPNHAQTVSLLGWLGETCKALGHPEDADRYFEESKRRYTVRRDDRENDPVALDAMSNQAVILMNQGKFSEALPMLEETVRLSRETQGALNTQTLISIHNLAGVHIRMNRPDLAHPLLREVVEGERKMLGEGNPTALSSLQDFAANCFRQKSEVETGVEALKELARLHKRHVGDNSPPLEWAYTGLRKWLPRLGREKELEEVNRMLTGDVAWPEEQTSMLVPRGGTWRYFDGKDIPEEFMKLDFKDGPWKSGKSPLGYGEDNLATIIGFGGDEENKHNTAAFRQEFSIEDPQSIERLKVRLRYDDEAVIYLNGVEVAKGESGRNADGLAEKLYYALLFDPGALRQGRNVLAVAVSQSRPDSSDLIFDLELESLRSTSLSPTSSPEDR